MSEFINVVGVVVVRVCFFFFFFFFFFQYVCALTIYGRTPFCLQYVPHHIGFRVVVQWRYYWYMGVADA